MRSFKKPLLFVLVLLVAALTYSLWWRQAATTLRTQIEAWIEGEKARGSTVELGELRIDGFPLWLRAEATGLRLNRQDGLAWQAPAVVAQARPWQVTNIALELPGAHRLLLPSQSGVPVEARFRDGRGHLQTTLTGRPTEARLVLGDVVAGPSGVAKAAMTLTTVEATVSQPPEPPADYTAAGLTVTLSANNATLPAPAELGLGRAMERLVVSARVMGTPPASLGAADVAAWTQAGGVVNLDTLDLVWGPLSVAASGTLGLDRQLQPEGAFTAEVRGPFTLIDALTAAGHIRAKDAGMAKTAVGLFSGTKPGIAPEKAQFPLTIQNHAVWVGPLKLASMPQVVW